MNEDQYIDEPLYEALEDTSWAINHGVLPTYSFLSKLSVSALQELEGALYQMGAIADARTDYA
jgi:hypothetical protein